mgnify:CR=1 FL=1|tara:strand:- start:3385 stop:4182 length:798 start_codon:yes stop_codon:yes gene_type:complete
MTSEIKYHTEDGFLKRDDKAAFYGFFTRTGGVSSGLYRSLNCGVGSQDPSEYVFHNRIAVARKAGINARHLLSVYQVHGSQVMRADKPWTERPRADAMVTDKAGIGLGILTADCAPVLFIGQKESGASVIGAAHAGWKGAFSGVLGNTVTAMIELGARKETIRACVGPCIGKRSYEVTTGFIPPFMQENEESERFFHSAANEGHALFDLAGYCAWRLAREGLKNVSIIDKDTYNNEEEFFSYRRATHKKEPDYGRQVSVITIREV